MAQSSGYYSARDRSGENRDPNMHTIGSMEQRLMESTKSNKKALYNCTLKGKINGLEETISALHDEIFSYKAEITTLRDEKLELEQVLATKMI